MKMLAAEHPANQKVTPYVSRADFCRLFEQDMSRLYLLSFLLTADHETAVKCFVSGLEDCQKASTVFKEWTESWARRTIVQNAIRMIQPGPGIGEPGRNLDEPMTRSTMTQSTMTGSTVTGSTTTGSTTTGSRMIAAVANLSVFERFVFVMSVLERYTDQECSLLLDTTRGEVVAARTRALQQIASSTELNPKPVSIPYPLYDCLFELADNVVFLAALATCQSQTHPMMVYPHARSTTDV